MIDPIVIELEVKGVKYRSELHKELVVGEDDINRHMDEVASKLLYWSLALCSAKKELRDKENEFKMWVAERKNECCNSKDYKSETAKEDAIILKYGGDYAGKKNKISDLQYTVDVLDSIVDAWKAKEEMLVSLGANRRDELKKGLLIKGWNENIDKNINKGGE